MPATLTLPQITYIRKDGTVIDNNCCIRVDNEVNTFLISLQGWVMLARVQNIVQQFYEVVDIYDMGDSNFHLSIRSMSQVRPSDIRSILGQFYIVHSVKHIARRVMVR